MTISEEIKQQALKRAGNRCECMRPSHHTESKGRCFQSWDLEVHHILAVAAGGKDTLENCEVLCYQCRDRIHRYGKP